MNHNFSSFWWYRYFVAPIFGTVCYVIGRIFLFLVSGGRWRVSHWPTFAESKGMLLEPWRVRVGSQTLFCADAAIAVGFAVMLGSVLVLLALWWAGCFSGKVLPT